MVRGTDRQFTRPHGVELELFHASIHCTEHCVLGNSGSVYGRGAGLPRGEA